MRLVVVAVLAVAALALTLANAAAEEPNNISIEPVNPTVDDDVLITIAGTTPCVVFPISTTQSHSIAGNTITITIDVYTNVCFTAVDSFAVTENVGKLKPGMYDIVANVDVGHDTPKVFQHTFDVIAPQATPEALPNTGGAPASSARAPLAVMAGLTLAALGAGAVSRLVRARV